MTQEEKELLLKDLCARLPYGVILVSPNKQVTYETDGNTSAEILIDSGWMMYLRPMSSMTEEERNESRELGILVAVGDNHEKFFDGFSRTVDADTQLKAFDWLNSHHFDYSGLIEKGLAIEAPGGMYNIKEK